MLSNVLVTSECSRCISTQNFWVPNTSHDSAFKVLCNVSTFWCILTYTLNVTQPFDGCFPGVSELADVPLNVSIISSYHIIVIYSSGSQPGWNFPLGGNFGLPGGRAGNINIAVNIAVINIHVSLIFLNNSWNHATDKSKSQFFALHVYLSTKYQIILIK